MAPFSEQSIAIIEDRHPVQALLDGHLIADSQRSFVVVESGHPPVRYFPREAVSMGFFGRSGHRERSPEKGEAAFFTLFRDGRVRTDAAWAYERPSPDMEAVRDCIAFDPAEVDVRLADRADSHLARPEPWALRPAARPKTARRHHDERGLRADIARPYRDTGAL